MENEENKETPQETPKTPAQKLKEENDLLEAELERAQRIRNESLLAGTSGGHIEPTPVKEESPTDYMKRVMENKVDGQRTED